MVPCAHRSTRSGWNISFIVPSIHTSKLRMLHCSASVHPWECSTLGSAARLIGSVGCGFSDRCSGSAWQGWWGLSTTPGMPLADDEWHYTCSKIGNGHSKVPTQKNNATSGNMCVSRSIDEATRVTLISHQLGFRRLRGVAVAPVDPPAARPAVLLPWRQQTVPACFRCYCRGLAAPGGGSHGCSRLGPPPG